MFIHRPLLALEFLFFGVLALTAFYTTPTLLAQGFPEVSLGWLYMAAYGTAVLALIVQPFLLQKYGNHVVAAATFLIAAFAFLLFPAGGMIMTIAAFAVSTAAMLVLFTSVDIFLEQITTIEEETGALRGVFYTVANVAFVVVPTAAAYTVETYGFMGLYSIAALVLVLCAYITHYGLCHVPESTYQALQFRGLWKILKDHADLRYSFIVQSLLRIFYAISVVYMPVMLTTTLGFSLTEMGLIFSIAMIPFLLLQFPLGYLADTRFGEKEFLFIGVFFMGGIVLLFPLFIITPSFWLWATLMFLSRIGASTVEIMSDVYFFKHMKGSDAGIIGVYRTLFPLSYVVVPLVASVILLVGDVPLIFGLLGALVLTLGIPATLMLKDTR